MRRAALILMLAMAVVPPAWAHEEDRDVHPVPALTVQGTGQVQAPPDEATVRLGVAAQRPTAREAQGEVNRIANAVLAAIGGLGVPREQIQTSELQLYPVYAQDAQPPERGLATEPRVVGYRAVNVVSVRLEKLDLIGPVVDAGLEAGANQIEGVSFGLRAAIAARQQALRQAADAARQKAEALAEALGVRLAGLLEVAEGGVSIVTPRFANTRMAMESAQMDMTPVSPGQVSIDASVTLTYRIEPGAAPRP
ncbi:MAG TPA: SIMPL domain-containing protein [Thermoanaerobaculia bacterium]|nr:SIMPL domain-containing protein [Thermoanaerobaculia bacterium]